MPAQLQRTRKRFVDYFEHAVQKLLASGITTDQMERLREFGLMARDNVTGFHEGRSGAGRFATLQMAIQHVKETKEEAYYVEMDLKNLGGLNAFLGHSEANEIFGMIALIVWRDLSAIASEACFFRHGGDEMSAFLINTTERDLRSAISRINWEVAILAETNGLDEIPHPKHKGDARYSGLGLYFGFSQILSRYEHDPTAVFSVADQAVENRKTRAVGRSMDTIN